VIDSHTGAEPTRLVVSGGPDLGTGPWFERLERFPGQHDRFLSAVANEPRGSDVMVGALWCAPPGPDWAAGVTFFENVGYLGLSGHGTVGVLAILSFMKRINPGEHRMETPAGTVGGLLYRDRTVTLNNVVSYRLAANVEVQVPHYGKVHGDIAWEGNWLFLVRDSSLEPSPENIEQRTDFTGAIRKALRDQGIIGARNQQIDRVELFGQSDLPAVDSKNFMLGPGKASACGAATSAIQACLDAEGKIREGQIWKRESLVGSAFEGSITVSGGQVHPGVKGAACVNSEAELLLDPQDPFCMGIRG
jgi:4-hydroxyproline epimerase